MEVGEERRERLSREIYAIFLPQKCIFEFVMHPWDANFATYSDS